MGTNGVVRLSNESVFYLISQQDNASVTLFYISKLTRRYRGELARLRFPDLIANPPRGVDLNKVTPNT